jgi:hypothetical protein
MANHNSRRALYSSPDSSPARAEAPGLAEAEIREPPARLGCLWDELFPAEQTSIVQALVERVVVVPSGADIRLRVEALANLIRDLGAISSAALRAAALRRPASPSGCPWRSSTGRGGKL